ncbi:MAG TPA: PhzF family phenazine biosynthesis protein [Streptosporangiaceae bacterium]
MAARRRAFRQVDVFSAAAFRGNPLAVVLDGSDLDTGRMQQLASWTNLSETTFVLPPSDDRADYQVRIFTTDLELPFAGHPTLGTCHAWLSAGGAPRDPDMIIQQCGAGLVRIRPDAGRLAFAAPPLVRSGPADEPLVIRIAGMLGIGRAEILAAEWADNGPGWVAVLLASAQAVLDLRPAAVDIDLGVAGPYPAGSPEAIEVRAFLPSNGTTAEDPVTGSLNASLASWLLRDGLLTAPYVASQGTALGRLGRVHIAQDDDGTIWVGGDTTTLIEGAVEL